MAAGSTSPDVEKFNALAQAAHLQAFTIDFSKMIAALSGIFEIVNSTQHTEFYPRIGAIADVQEAEDGDAPFTGLKDYVMELPNKQYMLAIGVPRSVIDDMDSMPTAKARYLGRIQQMGVRANYKPYREWISMLLQNTKTSWDGEVIFSANHVTGTNLVDGGTSDAESTLLAEHKAVIGVFTDMTDDQGLKLRPQSPRELVVLCDPELEYAYRSLYTAAFIPGNGTSSPVTVSSVMGSMGNVTVIGWSELAGTGKTFYIDASMMIGVRAGTIQWREKPILEYLGPGSAPFVMGDQHVWKERMRANAMVNAHECIVEVDKTAD